MQKIVINGKFLTERVTGIQRCDLEITAQPDKLCAGRDIEIAVPESIKRFPDYENIKVIKTGKRIGSPWEQIDYAAYLKKHKANDLSFCNTVPFFIPEVML